MDTNKEVRSIKIHTIDVFREYILAQNSFDNW